LSRAETPARLVVARSIVIYLCLCLGTLWDKDGTNLNRTLLLVFNLAESPRPFLDCIWRAVRRELETRGKRCWYAPGQKVLEVVCIY